MFLIIRYAKKEFLKDQNQNKEIHKFKVSTVQKNLVKIFFNAKIF